MLQQTRYFTPLYEVVDEDDSQKLIHYFSSPTGIFAIFTLDNKNQGSMQYVLKDHQGSLAALVNEKSGTEYFSFDAWGRRRNAQTWTYTNMPISFGTTRGFTMHEHLDEFKLINMNGRVYDPLVGRFISPDPFVQLPDYSQSYNRYSYAFNNPLRFSDPSGFFAEGDSTLSPSRAPLKLPFLPAETRLSYRPGATTNTDNTSLGPGVTGSETTLPIPYLSSKLSMDAEGNASEVASGQGGNTFVQARLWYQFGGGARMDVNLNTIDFSRVSMSEMKSKLIEVNLDNPFKHMTNINDALVYGTLYLYQERGNVFRAAHVNEINGRGDYYNFDVKWTSPKAWLSGRNENTIVGGLINGLMPIGGTFMYVGGSPYPIYLHGTIKIKP